MAVIGFMHGGVITLPSGMIGRTYFENRRNQDKMKSSENVCLPRKKKCKYGHVINCNAFICAKWNLNIDLKSMG